jgi:hypothetical protein
LRKILESISEKAEFFALATPNENCDLANGKICVGFLNF